MQTSSLI